MPLRERTRESDQAARYQGLKITTTVVSPTLRCSFDGAVVLLLVQMCAQSVSVLSSHWHVCSDSQSRSTWCQNPSFSESVYVLLLSLEAHSRLFSLLRSSLLNGLYFLLLPVDLSWDWIQQRHLKMLNLTEIGVGSITVSAYKTSCCLG